jgi:hypothetical protein
MNPKFITKYDSKISPKVDSKIGSKIEVKVDSKVESKVGSKVESKVGSKIESKVVSMAESMAKSKVELIDNDILDRTNKDYDIASLLEITNFLQTFGSFFDVILNQINIMYINGYKFDVKLINNLLERINGLRAISISYATNILRLEFCNNYSNDNNHDSKKNKIFSLNWRKNVDDNVSDMFLQIYKIKKLKINN